MNDQYVPCDFTSPQSGWEPYIGGDDAIGEYQQMIIKDDGWDPERGTGSIQMFLRCSPGAAFSLPHAHEYNEYVLITQGELIWMNEDGTVQSSLRAGSYVDRDPHMYHGPFTVGDEGCTMYLFNRFK